MLSRLLSQFSKSLVITKSENILNVYSSSVISTRDKHGLRKMRDHHDNYWVPRKREHTDDKITKENQSFLQEVIAEEFLKPGESPLKEHAIEERAQWTPNSVRTGVIARKIGIYPMWTKSGKRVMTTLLQVVDNHVIRYNPPEVFSQSKYFDKMYDKSKVYGGLVVGAESSDPQLFTAAYNGIFKQAGVMPKKKLCQFKITPDAKIEPGTPLFVNHFRVGDHVNVRGITRYHGFQGVMKRWHFKGGPASHGCTKSHRRPGCIGGGRKRGVWKGKKMPGLMGGYYKLMGGLKIWRINTKYNILYVHGPAVPGINNNYCTIYDCYIPKKCFTEETPPPFPTYFSEDNTEPLPEDLYAEDLHNFSEPSVTLEEDSESAKA